MSSSGSWSELGFASLQAALDEQSTKINASKEEGIASRRALTSQTKAFRKLSDEEKLNEIRGLLKNYQVEIDTLTNRCKFAESCFMDVYRSLALLPDPSSLLESQAAEISKLKAELQAKNEQKVDSESDSRMARELERQVLRVSQLEKQLAQRKDTGQPASSTSSATPVTEEGRLNELENEIVMYKARCAKTEAEMKEHAALADKHNRELRQLQSQLGQMEDYDAVKAELNELRNAQTPAGVSDAHPLVEMRRKVKQLESDKKLLEKERSDAQTKATRAQEMISKMEDELSAMQPSDTFSTISGWTAVPRAGGPGTISGNTISGNTISGNTIGGSTIGGSGGSAAVSGIIVQQRDRYKKRAQELEELQHNVTAELDKLRKELAAVTTDRQRLYERIRQLQALTPNQAAGAGAQASSSHKPVLYEPTMDQKLKELELDRRVAGKSSVNAKLVELCARALVDDNVRIGAAVYAAIVHVIALYGVIH